MLPEAGTPRMHSYLLMYYNNELVLGFAMHRSQTWSISGSAVQAVKHAPQYYEACYNTMLQFKT
jgi:hypothetical protein